MAIGTVKFYTAAKGFGFIIPEDGGKEIFVHKTALESASISKLDKGQRLSFELDSDPSGTKAVTLELCSETAAPAVVPKRTHVPSAKERSPRPAIRRDAVAANPKSSLQRVFKTLDRSGDWQRSYERYCDLARNAVNDTVARENFWQHAEHFLRMMNGSAIGTEV